MRRTTPSSATFRRVLVALLCAGALLFNLFALGHARGVVATKHIEVAMAAADAGRPCPLTTMGATVCSFSVFSTSALLEGNALHPPAAHAQEIRLTPANDPRRATRAGRAPFKPPRTA